MAIESDDDVDLVYQRAGSDPGLFVATNATGDWVTERVSSGDHWAPTLVVEFGRRDAHRLHQLQGADAGVHYLTNATGSWVDSRLTTTDDVGIPTLVLDGADDVHIVYPASGLVPGLFYLTNATGSWVSSRIVTATHDDHPDLALGPDGSLHLAWARYAPEAPGLYYMRRVAGTWTAATRVTTTYDDMPALAVDAAGKAHIAFERFSALPAAPYRGDLFYGTNTTGSWAFERLPGALYSFDVSAPAVGFSPAGVLHILSYQSMPDSNGYLAVLWGSKGAWSTNASPGDQDFPTMDFDSSGTLHVAYRSFQGDWPGIRHAADFVNNAANPQNVDHTMTDFDPSLDVDSTGNPNLAYMRGWGGVLERGVYYGERDGTWTFEKPQVGVSQLDVLNGSPDLVLALDDTARIATDGQHASNASGQWVADGWGGSLAVDAAGKSHVAYSYGAIHPWLQYATNVTGAWGTIAIANPVFSNESFVMPVHRGRLDGSPDGRFRPRCRGRHGLPDGHQRSLGSSMAGNADEAVRRHLQRPRRRRRCRWEGACRLRRLGPERGHLVRD